MNLEVNLDGQGPAERIGTLWARDFLVLGDPIISEVLQNADGSAQAGLSAARCVREQFEFEIMRVPFSVGHGQFVMHDAAIKGLLVSAHMRGKVDFRRQGLEHRRHLRADVGPHAGRRPRSRSSGRCSPARAARASSASPSRIQGSMARPQVIVNPLSLITPGIFREIFQMTPEDLRVIPRERPAPPARDGSRASSAPATIPPGGASAAPG